MYKVIVKNLIPILLCIIAFIQIHKVYTKDLTPWKGGGFGMFAMIDRMENRPVHINLWSSGEEYFVNPRDILSNEDYYRIKSLPDNDALDRLASDILGKKWIQKEKADKSEVYSYLKLYNNSEYGSLQKTIPADSVTIEVFRLKMNIQNNEISLNSIIHLKKANSLSTYR